MRKVPVLAQFISIGSANSGLTIICGLMVRGVRKGLKLNNDPRRLKRQSDGGDFKQGCTTTGYESRFRELCEEEFEEVCKVR